MLIEQRPEHTNHREHDHDLQYGRRSVARFIAELRPTHVEEAHARLALVLVREVIQQHRHEAVGGLNSLPRAKQHQPERQGRRRPYWQQPVVREELADQRAADARKSLTRRLSRLLRHRQKMFPEHEITDNQGKQRRKQQRRHQHIEQPEPPARARRHSHELVASQPKYECGNGHQHARHAKRHLGAKPAQQQRRQQRAEK